MVCALPNGSAHFIIRAARMRPLIIIRAARVWPLIGAWRIWLEFPYIKQNTKDKTKYKIVIDNIK